MINNYDNLDFCLKILFDYQYNKNGKCYEILEIDKAKIDINDIKKPISFNYREIMSGNFKFMHAVEDKIYFKRHNEKEYPCNLAISMYDNENTNNMNNRELINMGISYILGTYALNSNFNHILLPIFNFDITYGEIKKSNSEITKYIDKETSDETVICVNITEHYFKMMTLKEFIKNNIKSINIKFWKIIIFQVLYTLYFISKELLQFRHNKLDLDAIMLYKLSSKRIYKVGDTNFEIPDIGYTIKLCNFENSTTTSYYKNKGSDKYADNPFYDVHYFIHKLIFYIKDIYNLDTALHNFYEEIIPKEFRYNKDNFNGLDENTYEEYVTNIITPSIIMRKNNFFSEFIQTKKMDGGKHIENKTETESEFLYKMLGKKINYKEKKNSSNNNMDKYNSRKLYYPSENDIKKKSSKSKKETSVKIKDSDIFSKAEESYNRMFNKKSRNNVSKSDISYDSSISPIESEKSYSQKILSDKDDVYNFVKEESISSLKFDHMEDTQRENSFDLKNNYKTERSISSLHLNFDNNDNTMTERSMKKKYDPISSLNIKDDDDKTEYTSLKSKKSIRKNNEETISSLNFDNVEDTVIEPKDKEFRKINKTSERSKKEENSVSSLEIDNIADTEKTVRSKKRETDISSLNFDNDDGFDTATERTNKETSIKKRKNEKSESTTEEELSETIIKELDSFLKKRDEMKGDKSKQLNESNLINQNPNALQNVPTNIQKVLDKLPEDYRGDVPEELLFKENDIRNQLPNLGLFNNQQMMNQPMTNQSFMNRETIDQQMINQQMVNQQMINQPMTNQPMNGQQFGYPKINNNTFQYPSMTKMPPNKFSNLSQLNPNFQKGGKEEKEETEEKDFFF
jgi:hypothetical protein